jgi:hypothetical protein
MRPILPVLLLAAGMAAAPATRAADSYDSCTGFIDALPAVLSTQGVWCLRKDLSTQIESGVAIEIATNNVTVDCNGFKIGNLQASDVNGAIGVSSNNRSNATVRGCNVRGFGYGVQLLSGSAHLVEDNRFVASRHTGVFVFADGSMIRRNAIVDTVATGSAHGVVALGNLDVHDNIVDTLVSDGGDAIGLYLSTQDSATIRRNQIRTVVTNDPAGDALGITVADASSYALVDDNFVALGSGNVGAVEVGIKCLDLHTTARNNVVAGFATAVDGCDSVGNVVP